MACPQICATCANGRPIAPDSPWGRAHFNHAGFVHCAVSEFHQHQIINKSMICTFNPSRWSDAHAPPAFD